MGLGNDPCHALERVVKRSQLEVRELVD